MATITRASPIIRCPLPSGRPREDSRREPQAAGTNGSATRAAVAAGGAARAAGEVTSSAALTPALLLLAPKRSATDAVDVRHAVGSRMHRVPLSQRLPPFARVAAASEPRFLEVNPLVQACRQLRHIDFQNLGHWL